MTSSLLEARAVTKRFPGVVALNNVSLSVAEGEVLALIGENGAGKSTLMKILAGIQQPDEGEIGWRGDATSIRSVQDAMKLGIALIHQELNLADNLNIGANIFLGREPRRFGWIDRAKIRQESTTVLARVGLDFSPDVSVSRLSIGQRQLVEIAKALSMNARVIIMDEPTSSLSSREAERLFEVVEDLRNQGVAIIYISHRLGEVKRLADRVLVFRDGENSGELSRDEVTHERMVELMVGRNISSHFSRQSHSPGDTVLKVTGLTTQAFPSEKVSFSISAGEIVGIAGLVGAGRTEMLRVLFGIDPKVAGSVEVAGKITSFTHPKEAIEAGLALVPEDRKAEGIILNWPVDFNSSLPGLDQKVKGRCFINFHDEKSTAENVIQELNVKTPSRHQILEFLSGGNQQKVVLGKWLELGPKVLLLDEPTRGIDIGAKEEIYQLMDRSAKDGMAVLFVSSEMEEILGVSDRVLVMHEGAIRGELSKNELSEESVMQLATGQSLSESSTLSSESAVS